MAKKALTSENAPKDAKDAWDRACAVSVMVISWYSFYPIDLHPYIDDFWE